MPAGLVKRMIGGPPGSPSTGSTLDTARDRALMHSSADSVGPSQPGNLSSFRFMPVVPDPRMFTAEEADQLKQQAREMKEGLRHTKAAYAALEQIDDTEVAVEETHYNYLSHVAKNEVRRVRNRSSFVNGLERLRVQYAAVEARMHQVNVETDQRIQQKRAEIRAGLGGQRQRQLQGVA